MEYTINNRIEYDLTLNEPAEKNMYVQYAINDELTDKIIYVGRVYFEEGQEWTPVEVSEIFRSIGFRGWYEYTDLTDTAFHKVFEEGGQVKTKFRIYKIDDKTGIMDKTYPLTQNIDDVFFVYPLKRILPELEPALVPNEYINPLNNRYFIPMLSGEYETPRVLNNIYEMKNDFLPCIPEGFKFKQMFNNFAEDYSGEFDDFDIDLGVYNGKDLDTFMGYGTATNDIATDKTATVTFHRKVGIRWYTFGQAGDTLAIRYTGVSQYGDNNTVYCDVAKIDECPAKYYLMWFDRLGGIQMQPFRKGHKETSDYDKVYARTKYDEEHAIRIKTNDKYEINTEWLDEDQLINYEPIFVSPYLALYNNDTKTLIPVALDDKTFEYKTFKNQGRRLFNLKLNLHTATPENIIY